MRRVLSPALTLMNKLSYPRKFIVVGGLSVLSLLVVSLVLATHLYLTISLSNTQLEGLTQVHKLSQLVQSMQQLRGVTSSITIDYAVDDESEIKQITAERFLVVNKSLPSELQSSKEWSSIVYQWRYIDAKNKTLGLNDTFRSYTKLIRHILAFQREVADYYQLPIVGDLNSYYLTHSFLSTLPATLELIGQVRGLGLTYIVDKSTTKQSKIKSLLSDLTLPLNVFKESTKKFELISSQSGQDVASKAKEFTKSIADYKRLVKDTVLDDNGTMDVSTFYSQSTQIIDDGYQFIGTTLFSTLEEILVKRVMIAQSQLMVSLGLAVGLLLIVLYFSYAVYRSTINSIKELTTATHDFHNGNFSRRVTLETQDELSHVGIGFNDMASGFERLLVDKEEISARLRAIIDNSPIGIWFTGLDQRFYFVNKTFCDLVEVDEEAFLSATEDNLDQLLGSEIAKHYFSSNTEALNQNQPHVSYRTLSISPDNNYLLEITKVKLRNLDGDVIGLIGISQDITEKKKYEDELQLAEMVYQNSSEAIIVTDEDNKVIAINPALTEITGYSEQDLVGNDPKLLASQRHTASFYKAMWSEILLTGSWQGEIWNKRKDGTDYPEWLSINTVYDDDGKVFRRIALFSDISEKKKADELILKQANYDALTSLPNRRMFNDRLQQEIEKSKRTGFPFALIFIDLDNFKEINDTQGHEVGDLLLIEVSRRIESCIRKSDTVARLGGDEFTVILSELKEPFHVETVCNQILEALASPVIVNDYELYTTASMGITFYPNDADSVLELLKHADQAMYSAKKRGRNQYCHFTPSMQQEAESRMSLLKDLRLALKLKQLEVYYQPILDLETGEINKAEALLRWKHPQRGFVSPAEFIPLAEESGLIVEIGFWVFQQAVQEVKNCKEMTGTDITISVNKSPVQFRTTTNHDNWIDYLQQQELSGEHIIIEITESLLMDDHQSILQQFKHFKEAGVEVSMDDFGTGYSSLSYLKKFDIDFLKIDQSFTKNLSAGSEDMVLSEAIIKMAHTLGLQVVAEGIETEEQMNLLASVGCDYGQGYYFSKPVPASEFRAILQKTLSLSRC